MLLCIKVYDKYLMCRGAAQNQPGGIYNWTEALRYPANLWISWHRLLSLAYEEDNLMQTQFFLLQAALSGGQG